MSLRVTAINNHSRSRASGDTPFTKQHKPDTSVTESSSNISASVADELKGEVFELPFQDFVQRLLYGLPPSATAPAPASDPHFDPTPRADLLQQQYNADRHTAQAYVEQLKAGTRTARSFTYSDEKISLLHEGERAPNAEPERYKPLVELMEDITSHYRSTNDVTEVDSAWSYPDPSSNELKTRQRGYYDISTRAPLFSRRPGDCDSTVKPDLALMLGGPKNNMKGRKIYWKDIRVPIEVKPTGDLTIRLMSQVGSYLRAMKQEQFDRNFSYLVTISDDSFRIWRWDPSCIYVSDCLDWRSLPIEFALVIQRLHTLTPAELGYDPQFLRSGLHIFKDDLPPSLRLVPCDRSNPDHGAPPGRPQFSFAPITKAEPLNYSLEKNMVFESRDLLFNRCTRTWRANPASVASGGGPRVIKQQWQDDLREPEAALHARVNGLPNVATVSAFEALESTRDVWDRVSPFIRGYIGRLEAKRANIELVRVGADHPLPKICHRILMRLVIDEVGKSLTEITSARQFMLIFYGAFKAIMKIWEERKMIHRDISLGNILVSELDPGEALLIDFGLAQWQPDVGSDQTENPGEDRHHHVTGTLPYMAVKLLNYIITHPDGRTLVRHTISLDIESLFWVALILAYTLTEEYHGDNIPADAAVALHAINISLTHLTSVDPYQVLSAKSLCLNGTLSSMPGPFKTLAPFLQDFKEEIKRFNDDSAASATIDTKKLDGIFAHHIGRISGGCGPSVATAQADTEGPTAADPPSTPRTPRQSSFVPTAASPPKTPTRYYSPKRSRNETVDEEDEQVESPRTKSVKTAQRQSLTTPTKAPLKPRQP